MKEVVEITLTNGTTPHVEHEGRIIKFIDERGNVVRMSNILLRRAMAITGECPPIME